MEPTTGNLALAGRYLEIGQPERALRTLDAAGGDVLHTAVYWRLRAQALLHMGRDAEAKAAVGSGLAESPEDVVLLYLLFTCEWKLGDVAAAERAILGALRQIPEDPALLTRYALLVAQAGQTEKARRLVDRAAEIAPEDATVLRTRVVLSQAQGDHREAEQLTRRLLAEDPEEAFGHKALGDSALLRGRVGDAARHYRTAAASDPTDTSAIRAARESAFYTHPLLWPVRPFAAVGPAKIWLGAIVVVYGLRALGLDLVAGVLGVAYLLLCVYSWVVPPLLRRWMRRRSP